MATPARAQGPLFGRHRAQEVQPPTVEDVGRMIDELDHELFALGTINVKAPDVWGQNRMTKYRTEFEDEMAKDVKTFNVTLNAAMRRADLSALISGTSIGAALNPGTAPVAAPPAPDISAQLKELSQRLDNLAGTNLLQFPSNMNIGLEPTVQEDEKANYLNHLHELRRINAGDDLTDAPGYGLYLVRMPVSLLPGPAVARGKGAMVNVEARHILSHDLLANTFRSVVIMDTTYQLDPLLLKILHKVIDLEEDGLKETKLSDTCTPPGTTSTAGGPAQVAPKASQPQRFAGVSQPGMNGAVPGTLSLSESWELYGYDFLKVLTDAVKKDRGDWYVHDSSLLSWLVNELATAHRFMREQARNGRLGDMFSPQKFQELDRLIQDRNYTKLFKWRCEFLKELVKRRNDPRDELQIAQGGIPQYPLTFVEQNLSVTDVLVYALMVQSVMVDRQLKHDIDITSQRKGCACADLNTVTFYDLFPSPEAQETFNSYVSCKWPIHVFALDPAMDQQNELDLFSARSELQVALAIALASGTVNFNNATSYARQLQTDLETIDLNRTAVGFGAGDTTFGWRFYPRIQSPPTQNTLQRLGGLLGGGNYGRNYMDRNRRIEPGPRECVALVVTPNFIPAIRFTTSANWFDLGGHIGHHPQQVLGTADVLRLSHKVQSTKEALAYACDAGHYRPGEVERLADRLAQLEAQLPLQYYRVPLPFEADLTGSEIFTSEDSQLSPRLLAWYGEPPKVGASSTIYLLGTNFSVHEYDVIAGGMPAVAKLMSRNVMRITIDGLARPMTTNDGRTIFDIHTASPNGISNHLFAEAIPADAAGGGGGDGGGLGYSVSPTSLDVTVTLANLQGQRWTDIRACVSPDAKLVIKLNEPVGMLPPAISPWFAFPSDGNQSLQPYRNIGPIGLDPGAGGYPIDASLLAPMAQWIVESLDTAGQIAPGKIPVGVDSKPITINPIIPAPFNSAQKQIKDGIRINLKFVYAPQGSANFAVPPEPAVGVPALPVNQLNLGHPNPTPAPIPGVSGTTPPAPGANPPAPGATATSPPVTGPTSGAAGNRRSSRSAALPISIPGRRRDLPRFEAAAPAARSPAQDGRLTRTGGGAFIPSNAKTGARTTESAADRGAAGSRRVLPRLGQWLGGSREPN